MYRIVVYAMHLEFDKMKEFYRFTVTRCSGYSKYVPKMQV